MGDRDTVEEEVKRYRGTVYMFSEEVDGWVDRALVVTLVFSSLYLIAQMIRILLA